MPDRHRIPVADLGKESGEIISPATLSQILGLSRKTIYQWVAQGRLDGCLRRRGKHNLIIRQRALDRILNGPDWNHATP